MKAYDIPLAAFITAWVDGLMMAGGCITFAALLLVPLGVLHAADLGGVIVRFEDYKGPATVSAQPVEVFKIRITVNPGPETRPLAIRVELPYSGPRAWPATDVEVRDAQGNALPLRTAPVAGASALRFDVVPRQAVYSIEITP